MLNLNNHASKQQWRRLSSASVAALISTSTLLALPARVPASEPDFSSSGAGGGQRRGITSRDTCPPTDVPLTPLIPQGETNGGWTTASHPTFWVYVPFALDELTPIVFELRREVEEGDANESYELVYSSAPFNISNLDPGIVSFTLPESVSALAIGERYEWRFKAYCYDTRAIERPRAVHGWVERVEDMTTDWEPDLSAIERSDRFAQNIIWYDALTELNTALQIDPSNLDLLTTRTELLQLPSVQLDDLVEMPVSDCCTLPPIETETQQ